MRAFAVTCLLGQIVLFALGCGNEPGDGDFEQDALLGVKAYVNAELASLHAAAEAIAAAAPAPDADGWSLTADPAAVGRMRTEWKSARIAYERVEGAIAVLFPNLDASTDERYDGFLSDGPDDNLFDDQGVVGVHAIERILWAGEHPAEVVTFEATLPGYQAAAFPSSEAEARDFKERLAARLVADTLRMKEDFAPLALDVATAYRGVIGSMEEQLEKVQLASTGESESRYADHTLGDMRANLEGGVAVYAEFAPWLLSKTGGAEVDASVNAAFARVSAAYDANAGDGIPPVPATFDPDAPSAADLATAYGRLFSLLETECDPAKPESLVAKMNDGGALVGIPTLAP